MQARRKEKKDHGKKALILSLLLMVTLFSIIGSLAAYFSDSNQKNTEFTVGTLKLSSNYEVLVNNEVHASAIENLNPGDLVVIKGTIMNIGNKSAWIRDVVTLNCEDTNLLSYLDVYKGEYTVEQLPSVADSKLEFSDGSIKSANYVINGSGTSAEIEFQRDSEEYNYLGTTSYSINYTIYFSHTATNEVQGKSFDINVLTQALQFRNNNTSAPDENAWLTVSAVNP